MSLWRYLHVLIKLNFIFVFFSLREDFFSLSLRKNTLQSIFLKQWIYSGMKGIKICENQISTIGIRLNF